MGVPPTLTHSAAIAALGTINDPAVATAATPATTPHVTLRQPPCAVTTPKRADALAKPPSVQLPVLCMLSLAFMTAPLVHVFVRWKNRIARAREAVVPYERENGQTAGQAPHRIKNAAAPGKGATAQISETGGQGSKAENCSPSILQRGNRRHTALQQASHPPERFRRHCRNNCAADTLRPLPDYGHQ